MKKGIVIGLGLVLAATIWWSRSDETSAPTQASRSHGAQDERPTPGKRGKGPGLGGEALAQKTASGEDAPSCEVAGLVHDQAGEPVAGATVLVRRDNARMGRGQKLQTESDEGGRFSFDDVQCGNLRVSAVHGKLVTNPGARVEAREGGLDEVDLTLIPSEHSLSGTVEDSGGGVVAGAAITAEGRGGAYAAKAEADGSYSITVTEGAFMVMAKAPGYATERKMATVRGDQNLDFALQPGAMLRGQVVSKATGEPIGGATVSIRGGWRLGAVEAAGADGRFEFDGLTAAEYEVDARRDNLRGRYPERIAVTVASTADITIEVDEGLAIRGRVVDANEDPVVGAKIGASRGRPGRNSGPAATSAADGTFELLGLEAGRWRVRANSDGYATAMERVEVVNKSIDGLELVLQQGVSITGVVRTAEGLEIAGATVTGGGTGGMFRRRGSVSDYSNDNGVYRLTGLSPGTIRVRAQHLTHGYVTTDLEDVEAGAELTVDLDLKTGRAIAGRVTDASGDPVEKAVVQAISRGLGFMAGLQAETDVDGRYRLGGLEPRSYLVWPTGPGEAPTPWPSADAPTARIELGENDDRDDVNFALPARDKEITGQVVDSDGSPVADAQIGARIESEDSGRHWRGNSAEAVSDLEGGFVLRELVDGTYELSVELPGYPEAKRTGVAAGERGVKIEIPAGATLAGVVVDQEGTPVPAYDLRATRQEGSTTPWFRRARDRVSVEDPSGAFVMSALPQGTYDLVASTADGQVGDLKGVQVQAGQRSDGLRLELKGGVSLSGVVREDASGAPMPGVSMYVRTGSGRRSATTDDQGQFTVTGLAAGELVLYAGVDESKWLSDRWAFNLKEDAEPMELRIMRRENLPVGDGAPKVEVDMVAGKQVLLPKGGVEIAGLQAGSHVLRVAKKDVALLGERTVSALLRGQAGTEVEVGLSSAQGENYSVALSRVSDGGNSPH